MNLKRRKKTSTPFQLILISPLLFLSKAEMDQDTQKKAINLSQIANF